MLNKKNLLLICLSLLVVNVLSAQTFKYIGAEKCKTCHNKPASGDQYVKWAASKHAKALASLSSQASKDYAKKNGIADASKEPKCLKCHTTFDYVAENLRSGITAAEGVSCESCHGPGSVYKSPVIMRNKKQAMANGLVEPKSELCVKCHNKENPFFKEFNYEAAKAKITHPDPTRKKV